MLKFIQIKIILKGMIGLNVNKFLALIFTISLMSNGTAAAADSVKMSLDKAVGLALQNNRSITQYSEDREAAKWALSATRRSSGPRLSWSSTAGYIGGKYYRAYQNEYARYHFYYDNDDAMDYLGISPIPPYHTETSNTFTLSMPLYTGGRLENQREEAQYALNAADLNLEYARQQVKYRAAEAYFQVLQYNDTIKVQQEAVEYLQSHLDNVQIQYEVGAVAKADVLATTVQLANYKRQLNSAWGNYETAVAQLNNIIGLPIDTVLVTNEYMNQDPYDKTEDECIDYALEHRPDGISAMYELKRANAAVGEAKADYRPQITALARASMTGEKFFESNHRAEEWQIGLSMEWNIFDNGITSANVNRAKAAERKVESQVMQQVDQIMLEVHNAYIGLTTAEKNVKIAADSVSQAEDSYEIAKVRYVEGVDTNLNVMDAQTKLAEARNNYYSALYSYNTSKAKLDQVIGLPISLDSVRYVSAVDEGKNTSKAVEESTVADDNSQWFVFMD